MRDIDKIKERRMSELVEMRQRVTELETSEAERKQAEELLKTLTGSSPICVNVADTVYNNSQMIIREGRDGIS